MNPAGWRAWLPPLLLGGLSALVLAMDWNLPWFLAWRDAGRWLGPAFWSSATLVGDALVSPLLVVPFLPRRPALAWQGLLAALLATAFTHLLKPLFAIPRPPAVLQDLAVTGPRLLAGSFPSGHTASAFTVMALLVLAGALRGRAPVAFGLLVAALVGLSRVMVGAHWPADVLAGAGGGWACAALGIALARRLGRMPGAGVQRVLRLLLAVMAGFDLLAHDTGYPLGLPLQRALALLALAGLAWAWRQPSPPPAD